MVELAVSMTVLLILSAIAIPELIRSLRTYQLNDAATRVADMLKFTRFEAVRRNKQINFLMQASAGKTRWFIDGQQVDEHGGRNYPVTPMAINFNLWFSPGGLLPANTELRVYQQDVDWVFHAKDRALSPAEVDVTVQGLRRAGTAFIDEVPAANPPLPSTCDF